MTPGEKKPEVLIECILRGGYLKVSAVDSVTGREVSVFGPPNARQALIRNAVAKLDYMAKKDTE